ncbi:hypothetical protein [Photobacterium leiognathi]|uniref:hypothetical protein n=1 Tax=Photobacterium leiognathi TaxID=553611 RepID=UPI0027326DD7|nr:hypothetical protein [Photobacterium leiognathi]
MFCISKTTAIELSNRSAIQDYAVESNSDEEDAWMGNRINKNYFREVVDYFVSDKLLTPVRLCMENNGSLGARDIYVTLKISSSEGNLVVLSGAGFEAKKPQVNIDAHIFSLENKVIWKYPKIIIYILYLLNLRPYNLSA